jgi:magnesium-transporting ATPase (P-type)
MLVFMECIGISQRINNMQRLRDMAGESTNVHVFRSKSWYEIDSSGLLPGDIVRIATGPLPSHHFTAINLLVNFSIHSGFRHRAC